VLSGDHGRTSKRGGYRGALRMEGERGAWGFQEKVTRIGTLGRSIDGPEKKGKTRDHDLGVQRACPPSEANLIQEQTIPLGGLRQKKKRNDRGVGEEAPCQPDARLKCGSRSTAPSRGKGSSRTEKGQQRERQAEGGKD